MQIVRKDMTFEDQKDVWENLADQRHQKNAAIETETFRKIVKLVEGVPNDLKDLSCKLVA
jgi:hypothetical protein